MTNATILSSNEYEIMDLMWREKKPITRADVLKGTPNKSWNPASVHLILNSMLSKGVIKITDDAVKYGRTYEPVITFDEYVMMVIKANFPNKDEKELLKNFVRILKLNKC